MSSSTQTVKNALFGCMASYHTRTPTSKKLFLYMHVSRHKILYVFFMIFSSAIHINYFEVITALQFSTQVWFLYISITKTTLSWHHERGIESNVINWNNSQRMQLAWDASHTTSLKRPFPGSKRGLTLQSTLKTGFKCPDWWKSGSQASKQSNKKLGWSSLLR